MGIHSIDILKDFDAVESCEVYKSKTQEGTDKLLPKHSAVYVTKKPLSMAYGALNAENKKYLYLNKNQSSKLHAYYISYKKSQNITVAEIRKATNINREKAI